jgi:hypothetical protein
MQGLQHLQREECTATAARLVPSALAWLFARSKDCYEHSFNKQTNANDVSTLETVVEAGHSKMVERLLR